MACARTTAVLREYSNTSQPANGARPAANRRRQRPTIMGCVDQLVPIVHWCTIVSGVLLTVGGVGMMITVIPLNLFHGVFNVLFGVLICGAELNVETIVKEVAVLKRFWGKGLFFLYLGVPSLITLASSDDGAPDDAGTDEGLAGHAELVQALVGIVLTLNGCMQFIWSCTVRHPAAKPSPRAHILVCAGSARTKRRRRRGSHI